MFKTFLAKFTDFWTSYDLLLQLITQHAVSGIFILGHQAYTSRTVVFFLNVALLLLS